MMTPITTSIVSEMRLHCDGLAALLAPWPFVRVVGAYTLSEAPNARRAADSDVVLLDLTRSNAARFLNAMRLSKSRPRIVAIGIKTASEILAFTAMGIDGFAGIEARTAEIVAMIERVVVDRGENTRQTSSQPGSREPTASEFRVPLTVRELQVADLMNLGLGNKEIARRLGVEPCTAKNHVRNIMRKLGVHRRGTAVAKLRELIAERFSTPVHP